jgi:ubiquitin-protein ligase
MFSLSQQKSCKYMDVVEAWLSDGTRNRVGLFVDDDMRPTQPNCVALSIDGENAIFIDVDPPFYIDAAAPHMRQALDDANNGEADCIEERLDLLTRAIETDGVDEEFCEEDFPESRGNEVARIQCLQQQQMRDAAAKFNVGSLSGPAVERLLRDLVVLRDTIHTGWRAAPVERNLAMWSVEFFDFDDTTLLYNDFQRLSAQGGPSSMTLSIRFPTEYPFRPPFIRVVRPRFAFRSGRVTVGGSICTQILTDEGWNPVYDVESLLVTIRSQITDPEANARVDFSNLRDYNEEEALDAFRRVAAFHKLHGWQ